MLGTVLLMVVILAVGARASDNLRLQQERTILEKLPLPEAHAYFQTLKRRVWRVRLMRALTLGSLVLVMFALRRRLAPQALRGPAPAETQPGS